MANVLVRRAHSRIDQVAPGEGNEQAWKGRGSRQIILLARRAPTIKRWSLDARSEGQSGDSPVWRKATYRCVDKRIRQ
jgi:hypothetical protein